MLNIASGMLVNLKKWKKYQGGEKFSIWPITFHIKVNHYDYKYIGNTSKRR